MFCRPLCPKGRCLAQGAIKWWFIQWINYVLATFSALPWNPSSCWPENHSRSSLHFIPNALHRSQRFCAVFSLCQPTTRPAPIPVPMIVCLLDASLFLLIWLNGLFRPQQNYKSSVAVTFFGPLTLSGLNDCFVKRPLVIRGNCLNNCTIWSRLAFISFNCALGRIMGISELVYLENPVSFYDR